MQIEKPVILPSSNFNRVWHYSFQKQIIETKNEINIPWMNSLVREWSKRMSGFDCNIYLLSPFQISFSITAEDLSSVFSKREVKQDKSKAVPVSQLSRQLEESLGKPNNPFLEYSKFEGEVSSAVGRGGLHIKEALSWGFHDFLVHSSNISGGLNFEHIT